MNIFRQNLNQSVSSHLQKLGKIFSCKSSCKVEDLIEDNKENKKPTNNQKNYCNKHIKPLSYYCKTCKFFLCILCCSEHSTLSTSNHEYIELQNMDSYVEKETIKLINEAISIHESLKNEEKLQNLPDYLKDFEEGVAWIDTLKNECIGLIEKHFHSLSEDYLNLFKSLPCKFQKDALELAMNEFIEKIEKLENKETNTQHSKKQKVKNVYDLIPEIKQFNELKYENELEILKRSFNLLMNFPVFSSKKPVLPKININNSNSLENYLIDWVSLIGPTENPYDQLKKIRLSLDNYYSPQYENYLARIDNFNEQLILYNISAQNEEKVCLASENEIPCNHGLIITPSLDILLVGGQFRDGKISNDLFYCSPMSSNPESEGNDLPLIKKSQMSVNRVHHSLCYVADTLFCFGGRNNEKASLNSCEKYKVSEDKWENIASMHYERCSFGTSSFSNAFVFAFFGCQNDCLEKYDINRNTWEIIKPINFNTSFIANNVGCLQINPNQILILGGVHEKETSIENDRNDNECLQRGLLYNVSENSITNLGDILGVPLVNPSQVIISNKNIYCLGESEYVRGLHFSLKNEFDWIFRMKNGKNFEVIDLFCLDKN